MRQALNYAFNRQYFAQTIYQGTATASSLPWSASSPAYEADKANPYAFDLDKAKSLLAQAGVSGLELEVVLQRGQNLVESMMQVYQADLAKARREADHQTDGGRGLDRPGQQREIHRPVFLRRQQRPRESGHIVEQLTGLADRYPPNNSGWKNDQWTQLVTGLATEPDAAKQKALIPRDERFRAGSVVDFRDLVQPGRSW